MAAKLGADRKRFVDGLTLLVRKSAARDFPALDIIDTPGLVDGEISYPFDINKAIIATAAVADLGAWRGGGADVVCVCLRRTLLTTPSPPPVLVFLDPIGQALCSRTMNVVKALCEGPGGDKV